MTETNQVCDDLIELMIEDCAKLDAALKRRSSRTCRGRTFPCRRCRLATTTSLTTGRPECRTMLGDRSRINAAGRFVLITLSRQILQGRGSFRGRNAKRVGKRDTFASLNSQESLNDAGFNLAPGRYGYDHDWLNATLRFESARLPAQPDQPDTDGLCNPDYWE